MRRSHRLRNYWSTCIEIFAILHKNCSRAAQNPTQTNTVNKSTIIMMLNYGIWSKCLQQFYYRTVRIVKESKIDFKNFVKP